MAFGFILISKCGVPISVKHRCRQCMQVVLPAPVGPKIGRIAHGSSVLDSSNKRRLRKQAIIGLLIAEYNLIVGKRSQLLSETIDTR